MIAPSLHRATAVLGFAALASCLFFFTGGLGETVNPIHVRGGGVAVLAVLGVLAIVSGTRKLPILGLVAGIGFLAFALLQLAQLGQPFNIVGGDGSTMSLFGGLGIGLVSVWLVSRASIAQAKGTAKE